MRSAKWVGVGIFVSFLIAMIFSRPAFSHPPKNIEMSLNGGILSVNVSHSVDNPDKHYIYRVTIYRDNKILVSKDYKSQLNNDVLSDTFDIGPSPRGSVIKAEAFCVIMGSASASMTIP